MTAVARNAGPRAGAMRSHMPHAQTPPSNSLNLSVDCDASTAMCCKERLGLQHASCLTEHISKLLCCRSCPTRHLELGNIPFAHIFPSGMADGEPSVASQMLRLCCGASSAGDRHSHQTNNHRDNNDFFFFCLIFFFLSSFCYTIEPKYHVILILIFINPRKKEEPS